MKLLILDDHALFREGLHYILQAIDPNIQLLQAETLSQARDSLEQNPEITLLLIDLEMPVNDGFEALDLFTTLYPTLPCVILSASTRRADVVKALEKGALGFISKSTQGLALHNALKLILAGEVYVPYHIMLAERRINRKSGIDLTPRQQQVMRLVIKGHANKVIADKLDLAEPTVKMHLASIYEKLKVQNRASAIRKLTELKITLPDID